MSANREGLLNFNFNPTSKECLLVNGQCTSFSAARGWYASRVLEGRWEKGCTTALSARSLAHTYIASPDTSGSVPIESTTLRLNHQHTSHPMWTYEKRCVKDDTYVKARIGLNRRDDGTYVNGSTLKTGIEMETLVYAFSDGNQLIRGNTAPTMDRNKITVPLK